MTDIVTVASHELAFDKQGTVTDRKTGQAFDAVAYSEMKYGNRRMIKFFAALLLKDVLEVKPELITEERPPIFLASYSVVPPTPFHLSRYALETINAQRAAQGYEPGNIFRVDRNRTQTSNYARLTAEERIKEWNSIKFFFTNGEADRPHKDAQIVALDDLRITGAFTRKLFSVFNGHRPERIMLGFVALFDPVQAKLRPEVEDTINRTASQSVDTLLPRIQANNFDLTIRTLKLVLATEPERLMPFLQACPEDLVLKMYYDTLASGEDFIEYNKQGFQHLKRAAMEIEG